MIILGIICFLISIAIGSWRQACSVYAVKYHFNCPRSWHSPAVKVVSWLMVAILAIAGSFILANWIQLNLNDFLGRFTFGILLLTRWLFSAYFGSYRAHKNCP